MYDAIADIYTERLLIKDCDVAVLWVSIVFSIDGVVFQVDANRYIVFMTVDF